MPLKVTYIGHATTLIQWGPLNILTDPVFSSRVLFFKRLEPLPFNPAELPKLDAILLSHAHYDHLDLFSYKYIPSDVPIIIPEGMSKAIKGLVNNPIVELATWSRFSLKPNCEICAVPAKHQGGRFLWTFRYRTCHGYVISHQGEHLYFAGDTAYGPHLARIRSLFPIKLALLPHAIAKAAFFLKNRHMDWERLLQAWEDLGQPHLIPIHWGVFFKTWNSPDRLRKIWEQQTPQAFQEKFHCLAPGETLNF